MSDRDAEIEAAANSIAAMVIEWVDEGQRLEMTDWRPGLPGIIKARLKRFWPETPDDFLSEALNSGDGTYKP